MLQELRNDSFLEFLGNNGFYRVVGNSSRLRAPIATFRPIEMLPGEIEDAELVEGERSQITVNAYERNSKARAACIKEHGCRCSICGFDFESRYGEYGKGYIQVHHLVPLSTLTERYVVDPVKDLIPVCANCHAIIHRKRPPFTPDEVKEMFAKSRSA